MPARREAREPCRQGFRPGSGFYGRLTGLFLVIFVAAIPFSIFISQASLVLATLFLVLNRKGRLPAGSDWLRPITIPALAYSGVTLLSALNSQDVTKSLADTKDILLFLIIPVFYLHFKESRDVERLLSVVAIAGSVSALWGIIQRLSSGSGLEHRVSGPLSHYMTYAGVLMFLIILSIGRLLECRKPSPALWATSSLLCIVAILFTYSRNAWMGLFAGLLVVLAARKARYIFVFPLILAAVVLFSPPSIKSRFFSILDPDDPSNRDRLHMGKIGLYMIRDHPLLGVGPAQVGTLYPDYRREYVPWALERRNPHLHNNVIQIGAERGLLGLGAWLAFIASFLYNRFSALKRSTGPGRFYRANGIACVVALFVAGLFEYNFGDSEVQMMLLAFVALSFLPGSGALPQSAPPSADEVSEMKEAGDENND